MMDVEFISSVFKERALLNILPSHCSQSNMIHDNPAVNEQNDLNRMGTTYHQNLYQHLDKLSNPLLSKKLETTEL
jgi:hypothetical protein